MESLKTQMLSVTSTDSAKQKQGKNDEVVKRLEQQLAELKATMSNRLDTELRDITESINMLKSNSARGRKSSNSPKSKKHFKREEIEERPAAVEPAEMRLSDPKGFEDRLMNRVKEALKGIMD